MNRKNPPSKRALAKPIAILLLATALLASPAAAGSMDPAYFGEISKSYTGNVAPDYYRVDAQPYLIATVAGDEEFKDGQTRNLQVQLQNVGEIGKFEVVNTNDPTKAGEKAAATKEQQLEKAGTIARSVIAVLEAPDDAPFQVKADTATAGTLKSGNSLRKPLNYRIQVDDDAEPGTYHLNLTTTYRYLENVALEPENESDSNTRMTTYKHYITGVSNHTLTVRVENAARFQITDHEAQVHQGSTGTVTATVENVGNREARDATAKIRAQQPFRPLSTQPYVGDLAPGETRQVQFKVEATKDAPTGDYAIDTRVDYEDTDGNPVKSDRLTLPTTVHDTDYEVVETDATLARGGTGTVEVRIKNTGTGVADDAVAHISATDPFDAVIDDQYLGDLKPGETATAKFKLAVSGDAVPSDYSLVTTMRYQDAEGDTRYSDPLQAPITVEEGGGGLVATILGLLPL